MILIFISPMTNDIKHHFIYFLAICISSYVRSLFKCFVLSFKHFFLAMSRGMWDIGSLTRDQTSAPCTGSSKSSPLDHQISPLSIFRTELSRCSFFAREWRLWEVSKLSQWSNQRANWLRPWDKRCVLCCEWEEGRGELSPLSSCTAWGGSV